MEHVKDLQSRLVDGEDHCAVGVSKLVQMGQDLIRGSSIKTCV